MSKITNDGLTRSGTWCCCTHVATVGVEGLSMWLDKRGYRRGWSADQWLWLTACGTVRPAGAVSDRACRPDHTRSLTGRRGKPASGSEGDWQSRQGGLSWHDTCHGWPPDWPVVVPAHDPISTVSHIYSVSQKKNPPYGFLNFFP